MEKKILCKLSATTVRDGDVGRPIFHDPVIQYYLGDIWDLYLRLIERMACNQVELNSYSPIYTRVLDSPRM